MSTVFDAAMLILRVAVGAVLIAHGVKHAMGRAKTSTWFARIGFRAPRLQWFTSTATEIGVGVLLVSGTITAIAAAGLLGIMTVAFWTVHRRAGFWITARPEEGWEYVFVLAVTAVVIAVVGPGEVSVDAAVGIGDRMDGATGAALAAAGIVVAVGQLVIFWRPEATDEE